VHFFRAKEAIVEVGRRLWLRGLIAGSDGNISVRLDENRLLTTPTGVSKGFLDPELLVITDMEGRILSGDRRPSSELKMHLEIYRQRKEVEAVVHAHPPVATAFSVAGVNLDRCVLSEVVLTLGAVPTVPYATPSTDEVPESLHAIIPNCDAVLLANHGAVTWSETLESAWFKMESLEHTANILFHAMSLGNVNSLTRCDVEKLDAVRKQIGLTGKRIPCITPEVPCCSEQKTPDSDELIERIVAEAMKELTKRGNR
jgi:L-fuculose-phosphate aldolase